MATQGKKTADSNSAASAVRAMLAAADPLPMPPSHVLMRDGDQPFWECIVRARAKDEWIPADLVVAAQLSRCMRDIETQQSELDAEGAVLRNERGTMTMNPRVTVLEQLARREMALMRTLRMGGKAAGDPRDLQNKRKVERTSRQVREEIEDDELLA